MRTVFGGLPPVGYIETPRKLRVNWKSVLPASNSLGVYSRKATAGTVSSIRSA